MERPSVTLFMLVSADGKISLGNKSNNDLLLDLMKMQDINKGLQSYFDIEQTIDLWTLTTGDMQSKLGANNENETMAKTPLSYVIVDYSSLTEQGIRYFRDCAQQVVIVTNNKKHIALNVISDNIRVIQQERLDLKQALHILKKDFKCEKLTVQAGGEITKLLKEKDLVDFIDLVVAPVIVGGNYTSPLFGGDSVDGVRYREDLTKLQLEKLDNLEKSYYRVKYKVKHDK